MAEYILQEATLALPDIFKDRSMNLFTLNENGASEFTFVVSRASAKAEEKVQAAAARLVKELEITVPGFNLELSRLIQVDGYDAVELFYQFKNDNAVIAQKQTVLLLDDAPAGQKLICYIGTCPEVFSAYYHQQYQAIIQSIRFHQPKTRAAASMLPADSDGVFFALDSDSKTLDVFAGIQDLYRHLPLQRAKEGQYLVFARNGEPLKIGPVPDSVPVRYALWTSPSDASHGLAAQLQVCREINGPDALNTPEKIRHFLAQQSAG